MNLFDMKWVSEISKKFEKFVSGHHECAVRKPVVKFQIHSAANRFEGDMSDKFNEWFHLILIFRILSTKISIKMQ